MAYKFTASSEYLNFGHADSRLYVDGDMSVGFWLYLSGVPTFGAEQIITEDCNFPPMFTGLVGDIGHPWGVRCRHVLGGSFSFGVDCIPHDINAALAFAPGMWRYFGFSRGSGTYRSYYGSRNGLVACQTNHPGNDPYPLTQPGQAIANGFVVGFRGCDPGMLIGPFSYWKRALTIDEHAAMARCSPLDTTDMLIWSKMLLPPAGPLDQSPYTWGVFTAPGLTLPDGIADQGCASFSSGSDYALTSP